MSFHHHAHRYVLLVVSIVSFSSTVAVTHSVVRVAAVTDSNVGVCHVECSD